MSRHQRRRPTHTDRVIGPDLASLAGLLADRTRAAMCLALLDGRAWTATELARHRYLRLAGADTAEMIESLASHAPLRPTPVHSLPDAHRRRALAHARTCLDWTERRPHLEVQGGSGRLLRRLRIGRRLAESRVRSVRAALGDGWPPGVGPVRVSSAARGLR
jgi:hypothetical protein